MRDRTLWTWHVATGGVVLVLLGLHMALMHLDTLLGAGSPAGGHPIEWANVVTRMKQAGYAVSYVLLLGAALFHGFYGLRNILLELHPPAALRGLIAGTLVVAGLGLFVLGTWAALAALAHARAL
jgi:succinate dehydrogenase hydrophobic anchor subunit